MSAVVAWPSSVPFWAESTSWQEGIKPPVLRDDKNAILARRRSRLFKVEQQFAAIYTDAELSSLLRWYRVNLRSGVYRFSAIDPRTSITSVYKFNSPLRWRDFAPGYWRAEFDFIKLREAAS